MRRTDSGFYCVFPDEPSSGVDPASRRKLWTIINNTTYQSGRAVILTTHSMEECEALCDRLGIMQDGRLLCIGTPSHLRTRFGVGYQLEVTVATQLSPQSEQPEKLMYSLPDTLETFKRFITRESSEASMIEGIGGHMRWIIPKNNVTLADLFRKLEKNKVIIIFIYYYFY